MDQPLVTLVVPTYNYGRFLAQAVGSVLTQTLQDVELIIIDDCSVDDTREVVARFASDSRVRTIRHDRNQGHINSYNEGLGLATGRYVGLLSAYDYYYSLRLRR